MPKNKVTLQGKSIGNVSYIPGSLYVTNGEPIDEYPTVVYQNNKWEISLICGRKGSSVTADKFNQGITAGGNYHEYAPDGGKTGIPKELNFFFQIELTIKMAGGNSEYSYKPKVWLAQGHYMTTNNWWIGGNNIINRDGNPLFLQLSYNPIPNSPDYYLLVDEMIEISGSTSVIILNPFA